MLSSSLVVVEGVRNLKCWKWRYLDCGLKIRLSLVSRREAGGPSFFESISLCMSDVWLDIHRRITLLLCE